MPFLIYGAYGYTGSLIARAAKERGLAPVLAGRSPEKLQALADALDLPHRALALSNRAALDEALQDARLVLHCAGPFARTARPMLNACISTGTHYLDITGEIEVFQYLARQGRRAEQQGVMLLPGVGFDVVPTDCLAAHLKKRLPDAQYLELAIFGLGSPSRGTALTALEKIGAGGTIRRGGALRQVPAAWRTRRVDFGRGPTPVVSIPWGDVETAYHTTGIPNIVTYAKLPDAAVSSMKAASYAAPLLEAGPVQQFLKRAVRESVTGPGEAQRRRGRSFVWGKASTAADASVKARLTGPETYTLTVETALAAVEHVLDGEAATPGFQTPAGLFGPDFILEVENVRREDL